MPPVASRSWSCPSSRSASATDSCLGGVIAIVLALLFEVDIGIRGGLLALGAAATIFLGVFQSFIVAVPEGARALLLKAGRYSRTLDAGRHIVPPGSSCARRDRPGDPVRYAGLVGIDHRRCAC